MNPSLSCAAALAAALFLLPGVGHAQDQTNPQQQRMVSCSAQAAKKSLRGRERQEFMSTCLKAGAGEKKLTAQQERMKTCNAQAASKALKGDERKRFMSGCLKGDSASAGAGAAPPTPQERMRSCNAQASAKALKGPERQVFMTRCLQS